jgi:hypothetical protein
VVATAILSFVFSWNNFLFSVILRHIVSGLTFGAVKQ